MKKGHLGVCAIYSESSVEIDSHSPVDQLEPLKA